MFIELKIKYKMEYDNIECISGNIEGSKCRFILSKYGKNPLIVIGLNPSKADEMSSDATIRKIMGFIDTWQGDDTHDYDSFIMLNLYPVRETSPIELSKQLMNESIHKLNLKKIASVLSEYPSGDVLLCYGDSIEIVSWIKCCRDEILKLIATYPCLKLFSLGQLTIEGNPRHPSRLAYKTKLKCFNNPFTGI